MTKVEKATVKPLTKLQIITEISEKAKVKKADVIAVLDAMAEVIKTSLSNKGAGSFTLPGLLKIEKKKVEARPAQKNVPNPFKKGELHDIPAKKAHNKVKVRPLKGLKEMA